MIQAINDMQAIELFCKLYKHSFTPNRVLQIVCNAFALKTTSITGNDKHGLVSDARKLYFWFAKQLCDVEDKSICELVKKDHTLIYRSVTLVDDFIRLNDDRILTRIAAVYNQFLKER